jgi:voltage-gated potassium channel
MIDLRKRIFNLTIVTTVIFVFGTLGYVLIERWSWADALFMAAITLSTVGFGEVEPLSPVGRIYTIILILLGVGIIAFAFSTIGEYLISASVGGQLRKQRTKRMIKKLRDHVIICGYGRVGHSAAFTLQNNQRQMVVVDKDPEIVQAAQNAGHIVVVGDASYDDILREAGLEHAWGIIVCTGEDSLNLFVVLSARTLNPDIYIVARAVDSENEHKMRRAGANRVVSPHQIGGTHMANIVIRPNVTDFFDVVTLQGGQELWIEELIVEAGSILSGRTVGEVDVRRRTGVTLVALTHHASGITVLPDAETTLVADDQIIVLGTREQLTALRNLTVSA